MATLGVNIDHIATIREARKGVSPDPVQAAVLAELAGAHGITCHLREDRRHIQDRDVRILKQVVKTHLNLEMAPTADMVQFAMDILPYMATLVPEKRAELTTEGGLDVISNEKEIAGVVEVLHRNNILVSLFIDPDVKQVRAAKHTGVTTIEIHTGQYANAVGENQTDEYYRIVNAAVAANKMELDVNAGHGLDYHNVRKIAEIEHVREMNIGHSIIARSCLVGMDLAVRDMLMLVEG
jgi:pyridoxine 5-phosphate synthase